MSKRVRIQKGKWELVDEATYRWFIAIRARGAAISGQMLQLKAMSFFDALREASPNNTPEGFTASTGWLTGFKSRYHIANYKFEGEADSADHAFVAAGRVEFQEYLEDWNPENVYNCDETGLFFRLA